MLLAVGCWVWASILKLLLATGAWLLLSTLPPTDCLSYSHSAARPDHGCRGVG